MQLSKTQITALLAEVASQEDGFNELLRMSFEAMMKAERQEHLFRSEGDKGNGFRQVKAYGRGKMLELRVPRTREGNFYPLLICFEWSHRVFFWRSSLSPDARHRRYQTFEGVF